MHGRRGDNQQVSVSRSPRGADICCGAKGKWEAAATRLRDVPPWGIDRVNRRYGGPGRAKLTEAETQVVKLTSALVAAEQRLRAAKDKPVLVEKPSRDPHGLYEDNNQIAQV